MKDIKRIRVLAFLLLLTAQLFIPFFTPAKMVEAQTTTIFKDNFESNNLNKWDQTVTTYKETTRTHTYAPYEGRYHGRFFTDGSGSNDNAYISKNVNIADIYVSGYFYPIVGMPLRDNGDRFYLIRLQGNGQTLAAAGIQRRNGVDNWIITTRDGSSWKGPFYSSTPSVKAKWYRIDLHWVKSSQNGRLELSIDGNKIFSLTNLDTDNYGTVDKVNIGFISGSGIQQDMIVYSDLVEISSTTTSSGSTSTSTPTSSGSTSTSTPTSSGSTSTSTPTAGIIWNMARNSFKDFTGNRGGVLQYNSPYSVLSEVTYNGKRWIKSEIIDPRRNRAQALRWGNNDDTKDFSDLTDIYTGIRIFLPSNFDVPNDSSTNHWSLIYQLHELDGNGIFMGLYVNRDGTFRIRHSKVINGRLTGYTIADNIKGIYGRPFTVATHLRATKDGIVEVWIDGVKVATRVGDHRASDTGAAPGPFFSAGLYQNVNSNKKYMLFRDGVVANTYKDITTYLSSTS